MMLNKGLRCLVILLAGSCFVLCYGLVFAKKNILTATDPSKLVIEAQKMVTDEQRAQNEQLPVEESSHNGYWWIKQNKNEKLAYVNQLIIGFKLTDKKISAKKIVQALDMQYNPRDNPLDIKMDKSVERVFNIIIKEMMLK
ncbi:MAG: hypothetical protein WCY09_02465 [Candidatus Omnitrophota bacterium]